MRVCNTVRFQAAIGAALCGVIAVGIMACAGSSSPPTGEPVATNEVVDVLVSSSENSTTISVVGPASPVFTAYQESDPDRLVIDLTDVGAGDFSEAIVVDDGTVDEVRVQPLDGDAQGPMTRVEVSLATAADYQVLPTPDGLAIEVTRLGSEGGDPWAMEGEQPAGEDPWMASSEDDADMAEGADGGSDAWTGDSEPADLAASAPASVLSSIDARQVGEGSLIHLRGNGSVESAVTFTLEDPARLVIDLPAMKSEVAKNSIEVGSPQVSKVRVGSHADKVRVVVDGGNAAMPFDGRRVIPVPSGLVVALGAGPALDDAVAQASGMLPAGAHRAAQMAAAPAPMSGAGAAEAAAPAMASREVVKVYGVEFDAQPEHDRVVVMAEDVVDYIVFEPDPETVVLSIQDAVVAPEAAVRIAPEQAGAVSLVTAFDQPDVKTPEVRVVVKRAPNLKPEVTRTGSILTMDFPNTGELAAVPPVYQKGDAMAQNGTGAAPQAGMPLAPLDDAALASPASIASEPVDTLPTVPADAASGTPPASIDILNEGGLMDGKEYVGRRISLDFKEVDIADVLRLIAEVSDLNVIAGDEVKGKVTIRLVDVPWDQALDVILLTKGLGFARIGNVLRIAASDVLAQEEELRLQERRAKEKLEDLVVKLQPVNYADVKDISKMVKELLSDRGTVNIDKRTNTLIIKDIASVIDEATALIKAVDTMTPQVMIESKIVEAGLQYSRELGSVWTFGTNPLTEGTLGGRDYVFQPGDQINDAIGNQVVFGNPITAFPSGLLGLGASVLDEKFNLEVELQAAEVNGDGKVISSPRVVTMDNGKATIEQGTSIPFQTFENGDAQLEFVDAVLKLDVTPHITADGSIIMDIEVSRNAPDDSVFTLVGNPAIAKNQVKTQTLVKDGQTLVLGGIYVVDRSERRSGVPYLSRLPFLGVLFRSSEFSDDRKELLIFVTPRVVQTVDQAA